MNDSISFEPSALGPLLDRLSEGVAILAPGPWRLVLVNRTLAEWLGRPDEELREKDLRAIFNEKSAATAMDVAERVQLGDAPISEATAVLQLGNANEESTTVLFCRLHVGANQLVGIIVRRGSGLLGSRPLTNERRDPLTGLPDREFLMQRLATLMRGDRSGDRNFAVLFIDLDNFKLANDAHGHLLGDRVLGEVARRLAVGVREGDHVVRFGGDEFVVLVEKVSGPREFAPIIRRIHAAVEQPIVLPQGEFTPSLSIGVAQASPEHRTPEDLLRDADRAMYAVKRQRNGSTTWQPAGESLPGSCPPAPPGHD